MIWVNWLTGMLVCFDSASAIAEARMPSVIVIWSLSRFFTLSR